MDREYYTECLLHNGRTLKVDIHEPYLLRCVECFENF